MKNYTTAEGLEVAKNNLRTWMERATRQEIQDGMGWYKEAQETARMYARLYGVSGEVAAGVISALSPNNKWERNKMDAATILEVVAAGGDAMNVKVCTYTANKMKAIAIAKGDEKILKKSPKTYAFARNVGELDEKFVTIDKWHLRACQTTSLESEKCAEQCTPLQYEKIQEATLEVAEEYGIKGYELQAIVWVTIRNAWN